MFFVIHIAYTSLIEPISSESDYWKCRNYRRCNENSLRLFFYSRSGFKFFNGIAMGFLEMHAACHVSISFSGFISFIDTALLLYCNSIYKSWYSCRCGRTHNLRNIYLHWDSSTQPAIWKLWIQFIKLGFAFGILHSF